VPRVLDDPAAMADALRAVRNGTAWQGETLARKVAHAQRLGLDLTLETDPREIDDALERHIGSVDLLDAVWLRQATDAADAVAQLEAPAGNGTGFLVSPWLLLTNHHVVPTADDAAGTQVHFRYEKNAAGRITRTRDHRMDPGRFFITSPQSALDFTLVALTATAGPTAGQRLRPHPPHRGHRQDPARPARQHHPAPRRPAPRDRFPQQPAPQRRGRPADRIRDRHRIRCLRRPRLQRPVGSSRPALHQRRCHRRPRPSHRSERRPSDQRHSRAPPQLGGERRHPGLGDRGRHRRARLRR
jgi:hypothetical protein